MYYGYEMVFEINDGTGGLIAGHELKVGGAEVKFGWGLCGLEFVACNILRVRYLREDVRI